MSSSSNQVEQVADSFEEFRGSVNRLKAETSDGELKKCLLHVSGYLEEVEEELEEGGVL